MARHLPAWLPAALLAILAFCDAATFSAMAGRRHATAHSAMFDLGIVDLADLGRQLPGRPPVSLAALFATL